MRTKSGWLEMGKRERQAIENMLDHAERDIEYGVGGTYGNGEEFYKKGEVEKSKQAINSVRWILKTYLD